MMLMSDVDQPEGPISTQPFMNPDDVRGPDGEELTWPEPQEDPEDWEEQGESDFNDGTPGALAEGEEGKKSGKRLSFRED